MGGGADEDGEYFVYCVCIFFRARRRFPTDLRVDAGQPDQAAVLPPERIRQSLLELADLGRGIHLVVDGRDATIVLPGLAHDRTRIVEFLLKSIGCVEGLLTK